MPHEERWHIAIALFLSLLTYYWMVKIFLPRSAQDNAHDSSCLPRPLPDFAIAKARARPYRPFRWNYNQTMALMALDPDWWIELESTYLERIAQRKELYRMHGRAILDALPGSEEACQEVMFAAINFLTARYPSLFSFDPATGKFRNKILGKEDIVNGRDALCFLLDHVPEDFAIMQKDETTGKYHLRAGVVCSAVGWNMGEKMGMPLHEIHGEVPFYREGLQTSMDRYFERVTCAKPIQRGSWTFEVGQPLFLQTSDPDYQHHKHFNADLKLEDVYLRVDWQTLRRLPKSRAMVFNFKALFTPVTQFRTEPYVPQLIAKVLKEARAPFKEYKGWGNVEHRVIPALETWSEEQRRLGLVPVDWEERTLDEYPFYPGWEKEYTVGQSGI